MAQVHSDFPMGVLITGGLGADAASGALITAAKWTLFSCDATITILDTSSGGGSRPFAPGEIQNFYKPVQQYDPNLPDYIPVDLETRLKNKVIVKFKFNDIENEKEFVLSPKPYKLLVKILNVINITDNMAKITFKSIKNKIHDISVIMKKIRVRKD